MSAYTARMASLGVRGQPGKQIVQTANAAPGAEDGNIGDIAVRFDDDGAVYLYGAKTEGGWPAEGAQLRGLQGTSGWSPVLAIFQDDELLAFKVTDWVGGAGPKPPADLYVGEAGLVEAVEDAVHYTLTATASTIAFDDTVGLEADTVQGAVAALATTSLSFGRGQELTVEERETAFGNLGVAWERIADQVVDDAAAVEFGGLGVFTMLRAVLQFRPANDAQIVSVRLSVDNGLTYESAFGDYETVRTYSTAASTGEVGGLSSTMIISESVGNQEGEGAAISLVITNINHASRTRGFGHSVFRAPDGVLTTCSFVAECTEPLAHNAIQFRFGTGNIAVGRIILEGLRG